MKWISVEEKPPVDGELNLVCRFDSVEPWLMRYISYGAAREAGKDFQPVWVSQDGQISIPAERVTHYMPAPALPDPPK